MKRNEAKARRHQPIRPNRFYEELFSALPFIQLDVHNAFRFKSTWSCGHIKCSAQTHTSKCCLWSKNETKLNQTVPTVSLHIHTQTTCQSQTQPTRNQRQYHRTTNNNTKCKQKNAERLLSNNNGRHTAVLCALFLCVSSILSIRSLHGINSIPHTCTHSPRKHKRVWRVFL